VSRAVVTWELVRARMAGRVSIDDTVAQSAAKLGVTLKEKQREALLGFCQGNDVFVSLPIGYGKLLIYALLPLVFNILNGMITYFLQQLCVTYECYCIVNRCD